MKDSTPEAHPLSCIAMRRLIKQQGERKVLPILRAILVTIAGVLISGFTLCQPTLDPLAVRIINTSIGLVDMGSKCGWDKENSESRLSLDRSVVWSSALLNGAISEGKLTLGEATEAQAQLLHRVYLEFFAKRAKHSESDCKAWHSQWIEMASHQGSLKPLYLDLPTEDARNKYLQANATNCLLAAISLLDDRHSDASTIARAAWPYCHESIPPDLFADAEAQAHLVNTLSSKVLEFRADRQK